MPMQNEYHDKTLDGFKWSAISQIIVEIIKLVFGIVLARMLGPESFGIIGIVLVFTSIATLLADLGFSEALIQNQNTESNHWSSIFWLHLVVSTVVVVLLWLLAPAVSVSFDNELIYEVLILTSPIVILEAANLTPRVWLNKEMKFRFFAKAEILASIFSVMLAIGAANFGFGVYSLVIQLYSRAIVNGFVLWNSVPWRPWDEIRIRDLGCLWKSGRLLLANRFMGHLSMNLDSLIVGHTIGPEVLGTYNRAYSFMTLPVNTVTTVVTRVLFPSMSAMSSEKESMGRLFLETLSTLIFFVAPSMVGLSMLAEQFVLLVLGQEWSATIPFLRAFSLLGIPATVSVMCSTAIIASGDRVGVIKLGFVEQPMILVAVCIGAFWGVWGIITAQILLSFVVTSLKLIWTARSLQIKVEDLFRSVLPTFFISAIMGCSLWWFGSCCESWALLEQFCSSITVGCAVYFCSAEVFRIKEFGRLKSMIFRA